MRLGWSRRHSPLRPAVLQPADFALQGKGRWFEPSSAHRCFRQVNRELPPLRVEGREPATFEPPSLVAVANLAG
jgi:hypothetical protein